MWTIGGPDAMDVGINSIENNVALAKNLIAYHFHRNVPKEERANRPILMMKAHSRNAVAASRIARWVRDTLSWVAVEVVLFDPVPGPFNRGEDEEIDLTGLAESTLVYSVFTKYDAHFSPQMVHGVTRLIISRKGHGVGYQVGVKFNERVYKGSNLNSLDPGLYVSISDVKVTQGSIGGFGGGESGESGPETIVKCNDLTEVKAAMAGYDYSQQSKRKLIVIGICKEFLAK